MSRKKHYFFCGIGGSGMLPLAVLMRARGHDVAGSDRALDQGRTERKFDDLRAQGVRLFAQDGTGITGPDTIVVASAAVEDSVPDIVAATRVGAKRITRAELLAELFNAAPFSIAVGGTSGKSTTTGMIGWILHAAGRSPTVVNGAVMKNFVTPESPFASAVPGDGDVFVSEVDESDGSIALFRPRVAVLNNIALDHKPLPELRTLFRDFVARAATAVINLDNGESAEIATTLPRRRTVTYSLTVAEADLLADRLEPAADQISFRVRKAGHETPGRVALRMPGRHNVYNALAALAAAGAAGVPFEDAVRALNDFSGIGRRLDRVGAARGIAVIDDFAHNPDKIAATLETLHAFPGRVILMFQPHGFGPLRLMKDAFIDTFATEMRAEDVLIMPEPVYFGGTVERTVSSRDIAAGVAARGREAHAFTDRAACADKVVEIARAGDRVVVLGARDDTLSQFAAELVARFAA